MMDLQNPPEGRQVDVLYLNRYDVPTYKRETRSFSQMQTYAACSEKYRLQRVEKVPEDATAWAPQGSAFHVGMEEWELSERTMPEDEVVALALADYDRRIAEQWEQQPEPSGWLTGGRTKVDTDIDRRRERVENHTREYIAYSVANEDKFRPATLPDGRPAVEFPFEIELGGVIVRGAIDLILEWPETGALTIRDLKTGNKLPNDGLQLAFYALAWKKYFGDGIEYGDFFMCKNTAPTQPYFLPDYSEERLSAWMEMMHRSERSGIYLPAGGDHCRVCTVSKYCSLMGADKSTYAMPTMKTGGMLD